MVEISRSASRSDRHGLYKMLGVKKSNSEGFRYTKVSSKGHKEQKEDKKGSDQRKGSKAGV